MTELEKFAEELKELARKGPPTTLKMPPNGVGLPEGTFVLEALLHYIAKCLLRNVN